MSINYFQAQRYRAAHIPYKPAQDYPVLYGPYRPPPLFKAESFPNSTSAPQAT